MQTVSVHIKTGFLSGMFLLLLSAIGTPLMAQDSTTQAPSKKANTGPHSEGRYCVMLQEGKVVVMLNDKLIQNDVVFKDGSKLTPTGDYIKKGKSTVLKNGDCVDKNGELTIHTMYTPPNILGMETCTN